MSFPPPPLYHLYPISPIPLYIALTIRNNPCWHRNSHKLRPKRQTLAVSDRRWTLCSHLWLAVQAGPCGITRACCDSCDTSCSLKSSQRRWLWKDPQDELRIKEQLAQEKAVCLKNTSKKWRIDWSRSVMNPTRAFSLSSRNKQPIFVKTTTVRKSVKLKEQADQLYTLFGEGLKHQLPRVFGKGSECLTSRLEGMNN